MERHKDELRAAGLQLVTVALGEPRHAERYCGELAPGLSCLSSTSNDPYYAWGLYQHTGKDFLLHGLKLASATAKAAAGGHTQGQATGDTQMSTGTFIVDTSGVVRYAYYGKIVGDDPSIEELVKAAAMLRPV